MQRKAMDHTEALKGHKAQSMQKQLSAHPLLPFDPNRPDGPTKLCYRVANHCRMDNQSTVFTYILLFNKMFLKAVYSQKNNKVK